MKCQMCGHEQGVDEARDGEVFDMCGACGARILRFPKDALLTKLAKRDAFIEQLVKVGDKLAILASIDTRDDMDVYFDWRNLANIWKEMK